MVFGITNNGGIDFKVGRAAAEVVQMSGDPPAGTALVLQRPGLFEDQEDGQREADVADRVVDEDYLTRRSRQIAVEPERDLPLRADALAFPPDESE